MSEIFKLEEYYARYLSDVRQLSLASVKHYKDAINHISRLLKGKGVVQDSLYEITDVKQLEVVKKILLEDEDFVKLNARGHQMYFAGFNNYLKFASGEEFSKYKDKIVKLDIAVPVGEQVQQKSVTWKRSTIIKNQALASADYICEINCEHKTFESRSTHKQYMEGHHAIPLNLQKNFNLSLDIYANIVCLCPICHRLLHYGIEEDKRRLLGQIFDERAPRYIHSGFNFGREEFIEYGLNGTSR